MAEYCAQETVQTVRRLRNPTITNTYNGNGGENNITKKNMLDQENDDGKNRTKAKARAAEAAAWYLKFTADLDGAQTRAQFLARETLLERIQDVGQARRMVHLLDKQRQSVRREPHELLEEERPQAAATTKTTKTDGKNDDAQRGRANEGKKMGHNLTAMRPSLFIDCVTVYEQATATMSNNKQTTTDRISY